MKYQRKKTRRLNPFIDDTVHIGAVTEKRLAKEHGGKLTPASGALDGAKGDWTLDHEAYKFRVEGKATGKESMSLKLEWLCKIRNEARETNRVPALTISFVDSMGVPREEWVAIPTWLFKEIFGNGFEE